MELAEYGSGYGDGSGSGYGYGYGYGYGDGSGSGYGDGSGYWAAVLKNFSVPDGSIACLWRSDDLGQACNGGNSSPVHIGLVEKINGPLEICTRRALHGTMEPSKYAGERLWVVALFGEVQRWDDKLAALKRQIIAEIKWNA